MPFPCTIGAFNDTMCGDSMGCQFEPTQSGQPAPDWQISAGKMMYLQCTELNALIFNSVRQPVVVFAQRACPSQLLEG